MTDIPRRNRFAQPERERFDRRTELLDDDAVEPGYDANGSPVHERAEDQRIAERIAAERVADAMRAGAQPRHRYDPDRGYLAHPVPTSRQERRREYLVAVRHLVLALGALAATAYLVVQVWP